MKEIREREKLRKMYADIRQNSRIQKDKTTEQPPQVNNPANDIMNEFKKNRSMTFEDINKINSQGRKISLKLRDILDISDEEDSYDEVLINFRNKNANRKRMK